MAPNKTTRGGISLRRRVTAWLAAILLVTMLSNGIATVVGQWAVRAFDALLADNAACYTVQDAIKDETQAFARYVRQPTSESEQAYTAACAAAEQSLAALPFDYARIGAERYAHGTFCRVTRATGRNGTPFYGFHPQRIPTLNGCTM